MKKSAGDCKKTKQNRKSKAYPYIEENHEKKTTIT